MLTQQDVREALKEVFDPGLKKNLVELKMQTS